MALGITEVNGMFMIFKKLRGIRRDVYGVGVMTLFVIFTIAALGGKIGEIYQYWYRIVGPTFWGLLPLGVILLSILFLIILGRIDDKFPSRDEVELIQEGAPIVGLLGTIVALIMGFGDAIDNGLTIPIIIKIINQSLFSTAMGLVISLAAWLIRSKLMPEKISDDIDKFNKEDVTKSNNSNDEDRWIENTDDSKTKLPTIVLPKKKSNISKVFDKNKEIETVLGVLSEFNLYNVHIVDFRVGPNTKIFEIRMPAGVRLSQLETLLKDISIRLGVKDVRLSSKNYSNLLLLEVPLKEDERQTVYFSEVFNSDEFQTHPSSLALAIGKDQYGKNIVLDLRDCPHIIIGGTTGAGKSTLLNSMILSIIARKHPKDVELSMIDLKGVELIKYNGIPHLKSPLATDIIEAERLLISLINEMEQRYKILQNSDVTNIDELLQKGYNMSYRMLVIDEYADLMLGNKKNLNKALIKLAQKGRACGIHIVLTTQRPEHRVLDGLIKANFPVRIALKVVSALESRIILDVAGAEKLLGKGDMLIRQGSIIKRVQGCLVTHEEILEVIKQLKKFRGVK